MEEVIIEEDSDEIVGPSSSTTENSIAMIVENVIEKKPYNDDIITEEYSSDIAVEISHLLTSESLPKSEPINDQGFNFEDKPYQLTGAWKAFQLPKNNFTKGCKWAPDGTCIITNSEDHNLRIFDLPQEIWKFQSGEETDWSAYQEMNHSLCIKESEVTYDYAWYPLMSSTDPVTCCFLSTCKNQPVHLWDAFTGELRSTYRAYDHLDEIVAAHSLAFDPYGQHIYCGYNKMIRIFDVSIPGRDFKEISTKSKMDGQTGIISCIAVNPMNHRIIACGSYCKTVGLYLEPKGERLCILAGQGGGITHVAFSTDGTKLFSGGRKDSEILCWDVRNPGKILYTLRRTVSTNQRIYFDISRDGQYIISGNTNGIASVWDTGKGPKELPGSHEPVLEPLNYFQAHNDCVNGVSFHPLYPILATSSGQRKFRMFADNDSSDSDSPVEIEDNSLRLWWAGKLKS